MTIGPVRSSGAELNGFAKVARNIRRKREAEFKRRYSEQRSRTLVEGVPTTTYTCSTPRTF